MIERSEYGLVPQGVSAAEPPRQYLLVIATALACFGVLLGFGGLIGVYITERAAVMAAGVEWLPLGVSIPLTQPNMMALTMTLSLVTMAWIVSAMRKDDRSNAMVASALTIVFGFSVIAQTAFLLSIMEIPFSAARVEELDSLSRPPLFFAVIGTQLVLLIVAICYLFLTAIRIVGGNYSSENLDGIYSVAMLWTVAVIAYWMVWYAVYITK